MTQVGFLELQDSEDDVLEVREGFVKWRGAGICITPLDLDWDGWNFKTCVEIGGRWHFRRWGWCTHREKQEGPRHWNGSSG